MDGNAREDGRRKAVWGHKRERWRTSNGATKLILQNAAFRSGKLLRSTSWRVRPCCRGRAGVNRFAAVPRRAPFGTRRGFRESFALVASGVEAVRYCTGGGSSFFSPSPIREKAAQ